MSIARAEAAMRAESELPTPDLPRAVELNKTFHFAVYEAAHSPILVEIIRALWLKAGPVINLDLRANPERLAKGDAIRFHADVRKAIAAGNAAAALNGIAADVAAPRISSFLAAVSPAEIFQTYPGAIMDLDIKGLRVLVTAGAGGIGLAIARAFAAEGARVHTCDVDEMALSALAASDPAHHRDAVRRLRPRCGAAAVRGGAGKTRRPRRAGQQRRHRRTDRRRSRR